MAATSSDPDEREQKDTIDVLSRRHDLRLANPPLRACVDARIPTAPR